MLAHLPPQVNVFLAMTGQEEVQYKAFQRFGLKDAEIREFFNGPAFLTWSRGQSMQSVGSSAEPEGGESGLPRSWMQAQHALQKYILKLSRSLGIIGVLPAFQGNMPPRIKALAAGCPAAECGELSVGMLLTAVNGERVRGHEQGTVLLKAATGTLLLEVRPEPKPPP